MDARPIVQHGFASAMSETYGLRSPSTVSAKGYDSATAMDVDIATSIDDRSRRATSVLSMDDIEAAQTLEGLRSEFINSPNRPATLMHSESSLPPTATAGQPQPEPLLSLLTSTHPLISSAINGSVSAYATSKSYSRGFKYGAEFIERNIGSPVVNTVGSVSRKTGVEGGLRWALQRRETADSGRSSQNQQSVSQSAEGNMMDIEKALADPSVMHRQRSASELSRTETLPPYDDQRSPNYEEPSSNNCQSSSTTAQQQQQPPSTWQSRLVISTSGLGVAMSEESLRSLTYCLKWLKWANGRLSHAIESLKMVLKDWDMSRFSKTDETSENTTSDARDPVLLSQHVQAVKEDVLRTLKQVVKIVSKYAGGALPENARNLVRRHLTSLPQRFRIAFTSAAPEDSSGSASDEATNAHRVLVLAHEGLDMMAQVSRVVNDTLVSAETWCERLGRRLPDSGKDDLQTGAIPTPDSPPVYDVKAPILDGPPQQDVDMTGA